MDHPAALLDAALRNDASRPLVTFYDDATGERVELSVASFANWVAKTANLVVDTLGLQPGEALAVDLPRHWLAGVWAVAAWSAGLVVAPGSDAAGCAAVVTGPDGVAAHRAAPELVVVSLRPLGAPLPEGAVPAGALDYAREVPVHGDRFAGPPADPVAAALAVDGVTSTAAEVVALARTVATRWGLQAQGRLLVADPLPPADELLAAAAVPLALDASVVLCAHASRPRLADRAASERVTATAVR